MNKNIEERKKSEKIITPAWVDEEFKKKLLDAPANFLKECGI